MTRAEDRDVDDTGVPTIVSMRAERLPRPGPVRETWRWDDVLDSSPPSHAHRRREGAYVVRHGMDEDNTDPQARVGYATVVRFRTIRHGRTDVVVDERVAVEPRVLSHVLVAERTVHRHVLATSERGALIVTRGSQALSRRVGGKSGQAIERGAGATVGVWAWATGTLSDLIRITLEAPDRFWAHAHAADAHLHRARERRALVRGLADPYALSREGKAAALFLAAVGLALAFLALHTYVTLAHPEWAVPWRSLAGFFALGVGSTTVFPFFPELRLVEMAARVGPVAAITSVALGMTLGAWLVLFLGDEIHGALRRRQKTRPRLAKWLDRAEKFAARYGFWTAFLILSIPMGPDTPVFYLLATVRTPVHKYLLGALLGTIVRFTVFYLFTADYYIYT